MDADNTAFGTWRAPAGAMPSEKSGAAPGGDIFFCGRENNVPLHRRAIVNLAIHSFETDFGPEHANTLRRDVHPAPPC